MDSNNLSLLVTMLRHMKYKTMNRDMIGHTITREFAPINHDDIYLYVDATLDNPRRYDGEQSIVPPFYMSRLLYPMFKYFLTNRDLHINLFRMVHGQQEGHWHRPIRAGDALRIEMSVDSIADTPAGEVLNLRTKAYIANDTGAPAMEAVSGFIVRKRTGGAPGGKKEDGKLSEAFRVAFKTREGQQLTYARISGDTNFMHTSNFLSKLAGLPRTILHGVCLAAMTGNTLLDHLLNGDIARIGGLSVRFARPVIPGDELTIIGYESRARGEVPFEVFNERGQAVIRNGLFWYHD
jgi:acyl dehydratase